MLRKAVGVLLLTAIVLNIGAGILYNGIPEELKRIVPILDDEHPIGLSVEVPVSRSGDVYVTSYNMSVEMERTSDEGETDSGSFNQYGTMTRSLNVQEILIDLVGIQEMRYFSEETGEIDLRGELTRNRRIYMDDTRGTMSEERTTILETTGFIGTSPQTSKVDIDLRNARLSWEEMVWRSMIPLNRTLSNGTTGQFNGEVLVEELGIQFINFPIQFTFRLIPVEVEVTFHDACIGHRIGDCR